MSFIYVGNLPDDIGEEELEASFGRAILSYGQIASVLLKAGFAYVEYFSERGVQEAIAQMDNKQLRGHKLIVERGQPKKTADRPLFSPPTANQVANSPLAVALRRDSTGGAALPAEMPKPAVDVQALVQTLGSSGGPQALLNDYSMALLLQTSPELVTAPSQLAATFALLPPAVLHQAIQELLLSTSQAAPSANPALNIPGAEGPALAPSRGSLSLSSSPRRDSRSDSSDYRDSRGSRSDSRDSRSSRDYGRDRRSERSPNRGSDRRDSRGDSRSDSRGDSRGDSRSERAEVWEGRIRDPREPRHPREMRDPRTGMPETVYDPRDRDSHSRDNREAREPYNPRDREARDRRDEPREVYDPRDPRSHAENPRPHGPAPRPSPGPAKGKKNRPTEPCKHCRRYGHFPEDCYAPNGPLFHSREKIKMIAQAKKEKQERQQQQKKDPKDRWDPDSRDLRDPRDRRSSEEARLPSPRATTDSQAQEAPHESVGAESRTMDYTAGLGQPSDARETEPYAPEASALSISALDAMDLAAPQAEHSSEAQAVELTGGVDSFLQAIKSTLPK